MPWTLHAAPDTVRAYLTHLHSFDPAATAAIDSSDDSELSEARA
jgi:hypothetical protein